MKLIIKGKPIVHHHNCSPERIGSKMSQQELQDFAVEALIEEYKRANYKEVVRHSRDFNSGADFSFKDFGKTICGKVVYAQDFNINLNDIDLDLLYSNYCDGSIVPRLYLASARCTTSAFGVPVCGGDFVFDFHAETVMLDEVNPELDEILSHKELVQKYIELWETGDTSIVLKYFHKNFRCYPESRFNPFVSRKEYLFFFDRISSRANQDESFTMCICKNRRTNEIGILVKNQNYKNNYIISITTDEGRIKSSWTHKATEEYIEFHEKQELYQSHGDHINAIMPSELFIKELLPKVIRKSALYKKSYLHEHPVFSLRFNDNGIDFLSIFEKKDGKEASEFVSAYPYLPGNIVTVEIDTILEWDNQLEATVLCHIEDFHFAFFATDYYSNRDMYIVGSSVKLNLSALGLNVKLGEEGFSFEGQQAIDFLEKIGQEPEFNTNGEVEPLKFSLKELVAFLNKDDKCPDEAEFQSPIAKIEKISILGVNFNKGDIFINRDNDVVVPIYFSDAQLAPSTDHPISGWLWLMGCLNLSVKEQETINLTEIGNDFRYTIKSFDFEAFDELNFLLDPLKGISLPDGFDLDAISVGDRSGSTMHLYATKNEREFEPIIDSDGNVTNIMEDDMYLCGKVSYKVADAIPPLNRYLIVENSIAGVWSSFLLNMSEYFLPREWHAAYGARHFILSLEDLDDIKSVDCFKFRNTEILPSITYTNDNSGTIRVSYWRNYGGLIRDTYDFVWQDNTVKFTLKDSLTLVYYKSSIIF
jgi:hypothetical protein